jgi:hypothetical protein
LSEDLTKARYARWGGIPRYVLEFTDPGPQALLLDAIKAARLESILSYTGEENTPDDISHKILHIVVHCSEPNVLERYIHKHVEFASYYVAHEVLGTVHCFRSACNACINVLRPHTYFLLGKLEKHGFYKLLRQARQNEVSPGGRGGHFEVLAHNILQRGGKFTIRNLGM